MFDQLGVFQEATKLTDISNVLNQAHAVELNPTSNAALTESDLDKIRVVPNPYVISAQWDRRRIGNSVYGEPIRNIAFTNLPTPCTIKIFTVDGDLLQTIEHTNPTGREEWNLLTREQRPVVSGIYFYHLRADGFDRILRMMFVR